MALRLNIIITVTLLLAARTGIAQTAEEVMAKQALSLFEQENYGEALPLYSQLLALQVKNQEYNFRFGACQLYTSQDKEEAMKFLEYGSKGSNVPPLAYFYYGLGLHLNYRFDKAIEQYRKYQPIANKRDREAALVNHYIKQCESGKTLVSNFTDISVVQREVLPRTEFYRNYDLSTFGGKIIVKPEDFMTEEDKKRNAKFLMYFQQNADYIYYAGYSEKNATGKDLYYIQKLPTGGWSKPTRLSDVINTPLDEEYPFIHPDGNVLYFASQGHNSMGGFDIFKSTRKGDGTWTAPVNMEFAINTPWDDFLFISDKDETTAWFASNRETDNKQVTVYRIGIERVPLDLTLIKGTFKVAEGSHRAKITVEDMTQNKVIGVFHSERQLGGYLLDLRGSGKYKFTVEAEQSNAIHTGIVEVPRDKGLKQFRQEMTLVNNGGREQLQIVNHFDEPLEGGESLLTAEILKKQASLAVNASEEEVARTTEILDENAGGIAAADGAGMSQAEKLEKVQKTLQILDADAKIMDKKAALLYEKAESQANVSAEENVATAAISAELASIYKNASDERAAASKRLSETLAKMEAGTLDEAAFNAQYNQLMKSVSNLKTREQFDAGIPKDFEQRQQPIITAHEAKKAEVEKLETGQKDVSEEIAYYQSEIAASKDAAVKEELEFQLKEAQTAKQANDASLARAKKELTEAEKQKAKAGEYYTLTQSLLAITDKTYETSTSTVQTASIDQLFNSLKTRLANDAALIAMIEPQKAAAATEAALAESRKNQEGNTQLSALNEEIRTIEGSESKPNIIRGNYAQQLKQEIEEASNAEDPVIAESRKAELYDQWADNIQYRIDSLEKALSAGTTDTEKTALSGQIAKLTTEKQEKEQLAMTSYEAVAAMSDKQAISEIPGGQPQQSAQSTKMAQSEAEPKSAKNEPPVLHPREPLKAPVAQKTTEQHAAENFPDIPISVAITSQTYTDKLAATAAIADPITKTQTQIALNKEWANALQNELTQLAAQIKAATSAEERFALEENAAAISSLRLQRQSEAASLTQKADRIEREAKYVEAQGNIQKQVAEHVENYNSEAFTQLQSEIQDISNADERNAQLKILGKSWLMAIENEKVKTGARLVNTTDPNQQADLKNKLARLETEKLLVQIDLANLDQPTEVQGGPAAPKAVVVEGSSRYEGYISAEPVKAQEYDALNQKTLVSISNKQQEIGNLETQLVSAKKNQKPAIQQQIEAKQYELKTLQFESKFYQGAEPTLANAETALLSKSSTEKRPSESLADKAAFLATEAETLRAAAAAKRAAANAAKKEPEREILMADVRDADHLALLKQRDADLTKTLAADIAAIENAAIARNFIIPPGEEAPLPIVTSTLNPNEQNDVKRTEQFQSYDAQRTQAGVLRAQAAGLEAREIQLKEQGHQRLAQPTTTNEDRVRATNEAFVYYERADSLGKAAARLTREAAVMENEANKQLLQNPPEVYNAIISYYQSVPQPPAPAPEQPAPAPVVAATSDPVMGEIIDIQFEQPVSDSSAQQQAVAAAPTVQPTQPQTPEEPFNLLPPTTGAEKARTEVKPDVLTKTIFEAVPNATTSVYNTQNPIPVNPKLPSGVIYKVQLGAFKNSIKQDAFKGIKPITGETTSNGMTRYTAGEFSDFASANYARDEVREIGYRDAFVVAYNNGQRITISQARSMEGAVASAPTAQTNTPVQKPTGTLPAGSQVKQGGLVIQDIVNQSGTFYTVQVGVYSRSVTSRDIFNLTPLNQENLPNGKYRYTYGVYPSEPLASRARDDIRALGVTDAFVTAYRSGTRITIDQARADLGSPIPPANAEQPATPSQPVKPESLPSTEQPAQTGSYSIMLGTFQGAIPVKEASAILMLDGSQVEKTANSDGTSTYTYGRFSTEAEAQTEAQRLVGLGLTQAKAIQR